MSTSVDTRTPERPLDAARAVLFHDRVEVLHWEYSSNNGARVKLALPDRDALQAFDRLARRSAKRAGQRFSLHWQTLEGEPIETALMPSEAWYCGANWSHNEGASIKLSIHPDELDLLTGLVTRDQRGAGQEFYLALTELADDGQPIDQVQRSFVEALDRPKGGPISKNAGMLCNDPDFAEFVGQLGSLTPAEWIRQQCRVESRALLDHDEAAANRYETLVKRPFHRWAQNGHRS